MKKVIIILFPFFIFYSCGNSVSEISENNDSAETIDDKLENAKIITADGFYFAKKSEQGVDELDPPVYNRGELVYFVLRNVGDFGKDNEGNAHFEMHMKVENAVGQTVVVKRDILKTKGIRKLPENRLQLPNARFQTKDSDSPGTYKFFIVIEDKLSNDSITVSGDFFIE